MIYRNEFKLEGSKPLNLPLFHSERKRCHSMLFELCLQEGKRQVRTKNWDVLFVTEQKRHATDVVLVTVG